MSTPTDPGTAAIIYYYSTATLVNYCTLGRTAFILYEWTLLNLQSANRKMLQLDHENMTHTVSSGSSSLPTDSVVFAWVIGSIGSSTLPDDSNAPGLEDDDEDFTMTGRTGHSDGEAGKETVINNEGPGHAHC